MSVHRREEILARMFELLETLKSAPIPVDERLVTVVRNRGKLEQDKRPAAYLLDGDETGAPPEPSVRGRVRMSPRLVTMNPQVFVVLKTKGPQNELVGQTLNIHRGRIINLFASDAQLQALIGTNGELTYDGMLTDLKTGNAMEGEMQLNFSIRYFVNPYS